MGDTLNQTQERLLAGLKYDIEQLKRNSRGPSTYSVPKAQPTNITIGVYYASDPAAGGWNIGVPVVLNDAYWHAARLAFAFNVVPTSIIGIVTEIDIPNTFAWVCVFGRATFDPVFEPNKVYYVGLGGNVTLDPSETGRALLTSVGTESGGDPTGEVWVDGTPRAATETLDSIGDVNLTALADGDTIVWDDGTNKWVNVPGGGASFADQPANFAFMGPASGADAPPDFRALVVTDLPVSLAAGGPVGAAAEIPIITWDDYGRLTAVSTAYITPSSIGAATAFTVEVANTIFAGPASGSPALPAFRTLTTDDIPPLNFADLQDVSVVGVLDKEILQYDAGGSVWVNVAFTLANLTDVLISSPVNLDLLQYDSGSGKWINAAIIPTASTLATLTDVDVSGVADTEILQYDSGSSLWLNVPFTLKNLTDTTVPTPADLDFLRYDAGSSKWINSPFVPGAGSIATLTDVDVSTVVDTEVLQYSSGTWYNVPFTLKNLTDTNIPTPADLDFLRYNAGSGKWVNSAAGTSASLATLTDVDVSTVVNGEVIQYSSGTWFNVPFTLKNLTDTVVPSPANNDYLRYNSGSGKWVNVAVSPGAGSIATDTDVTLTSITNNDYLHWNAGTSKWVNGQLGNLALMNKAALGTNIFQWALDGYIEKSIGNTGNTYIESGIKLLNTNAAGTSSPSILFCFRSASLGLTASTGASHSCHIYDSSEGFVIDSWFDSSFTKGFIIQFNGSSSPSVAPFFTIRRNQSVVDNVTMTVSGGVLTIAAKDPSAVTANFTFNPNGTATIPILVVTGSTTCTTITSSGNLLLLNGAVTRITASTSLVRIDSTAVQVGTTSPNTYIGNSSGSLLLGAGLIGFYTAAPVVRPTISGSRGGNVALTNFLNGLTALGLITNSTTP